MGGPGSGDRSLPVETLAEQLRNWSRPFPNPALEEVAPAWKLAVPRLDTGRLLSVLEVDRFEIVECALIAAFLIFEQHEGVPQQEDGRLFKGSSVH